MPRWFGPRASPDDPAVSALIDRVARGAGLALGGGLNLNVRIDAEPPVVLRVHRPWVRRGQVAGLRRFGNSFAEQVASLRQVRFPAAEACGSLIVGLSLRSSSITCRHGGRGLLRPRIRGARTHFTLRSKQSGSPVRPNPRRPQNLRPTARLGRLTAPQARTPQRAGRASDAPTDWRALPDSGGRSNCRALGFMGTTNWATRGEL